MTYLEAKRFVLALVGVCPECHLVYRLIHSLDFGDELVCDCNINDLLPL